MAVLGCDIILSGKYVPFSYPVDGGSRFLRNAIYVLQDTSHTLLWRKE
jgi:hypothetical protein